jgi:uncharacterized protein
MVSKLHGYLPRRAESQLDRALKRSPVVALLGPRQCGKSTLARQVIRGRNAVYLDLQDRADRNKLTEPELFFDGHRQQLVCLDEIQLVPDFFSLLRSEVDRDRRPGRFLLLGSASRDLIRQSSESLAGRLSLVDLTPFLWPEVDAVSTIRAHWRRGGFPDSLLATDEQDSFDWRLDFIRTFLERDIPALGLSIPIPIIERLWRLLAHYHGQTINYSKLASSIDVSTPTLKKYIAILEQTYIIRLLPPAETNLKKRLIRSPKLYLRDSGLLHALLDLEDHDQILAHPCLGASWEGYATEQILATHPRWQASFLRTSSGAEIDLLLERAGKQVMIEFKASKTPKPSRGFHELINDVQPERAMLVAPVDSGYPLTKQVDVVPIPEFRL